MASRLSDLVEEARLSARAFRDFGEHFFNPTIRLGVTGLSRAGKTVFITALIHGLTRGGRFPVFEPFASGRIARARLEPQPDDAVPRFDYENHVRALIEERRWPNSTIDISELRLVIDYQRRNGADRSLTLDIVDYPGEWLLDLPLLNKSYEQWSKESLALSRASLRAPLAAPWHAHLATLDAEGREDEQAALAAAKLFTEYLRACRDERFAMSLLPPGRFLMPGNLAGSPALTFAPLDPAERQSFSRGSLWAMMERRYEAYKSHVVRPFFRDHFARLDRQIVLVDALAALDGGPPAVADLEHAMTEVLGCFRTGANSLWSSLFAPRIDRIVFAATKADHLHHRSHDRLEAILGKLTQSAIERAKFAGAEVKVLALAAIRATREGEAKRNGEVLPCIVGYPLPGEVLGRRRFDGTEPFAIFPGDLPADPETALASRQGSADDVRFVRFRPPDPVLLPGGGYAPFPNIRLDRAVQALIGDRLK
jgi:predicted YcjX-like family ATPase